ncbi:GDSL esterase/lipase [Nymphaea thermarum]|nr:GDSL esterase/lipase [Nymphaea thermarum]
MAAAVALVVSVLALSAMAEAGSPIVQYIFGDSLTEVGNNNYLASLAKANYPWYGIDYPSGVTGRFTNGRTMGDILSEKLGVPSPPAYLSLSQNDDAILQGVNYASGGSGILNQTGVYFVQCLSFHQQIDYFEATKNAIKGKIGEHAAEKLVNNAIFYIGVGSNDFVNNFLQPFMPDAQQYDSDTFIDYLMSTLDGQLTRLHSLGARKIVYNGLGPMGCIPSQRVRTSTGECFESVNSLALKFNSALKAKTKELNSRLPDADFTVADIYSIVLDLIMNPATYGFKYANTSCCNVDGTLGGLCLPNTRLCSSRHDYVFWDAYHPSDAANVVIAEKLFNDPDLQIGARANGYSAPPSPKPQRKHLKAPPRMP